VCSDAAAAVLLLDGFGHVFNTLLIITKMIKSHSNDCNFDVFF